MVRTLSELFVKFLNWMPTRNKICQNGMKSFYSDAQPGPTKRQTPFSWHGDECSAQKMPFSGHIIKKFRRPTIRQLNIQGLTGSKMTYGSKTSCRREEALVTIPLETHCTTTQRPVIANFKVSGSSLSRKHGLATFVHERLNWTWTVCSQFPPSSD